MEHKDLFQQRYKPQIDLGGFGIRGQEALLNARVLIVGTKESSTSVLMHLALMGVGGLGIVDHRTISTDDIHLQPLLSFNDVGKSAVHTLAQRIREVNPDVKTEIHDAFLDPDNALEIFSSYNVVISATDNYGTALLINDACMVSGIPFVYGSAHKYEGKVSVFNYKGGATFRCMSSSEGNIQNRHEPGVLGILTAITGSYMAGEAVKIITGIGDVLSEKLLIIDWLTNHHEIIRITPNPENFKITTLRPEDYHLTEDLPQSRGLAVTSHQLSLKLSYQESLQLVDIREYDQWASNHLENAIHIPHTDILNHLDKIHQDLPVILISNDGQSGKELSSLLNEKYGFGNIYYLEGGMKALSS